MGTTFTNAVLAFETIIGFLLMNFEFLSTHSFSQLCTACPRIRAAASSSFINSNNVVPFMLAVLNTELTKVRFFAKLTQIPTCKTDIILKIKVRRIQCKTLTSFSFVFIFILILHYGRFKSRRGSFAFNSMRHTLLTFGSVALLDESHQVLDIVTQNIDFKSSLITFKIFGKLLFELLFCEDPIETDLQNFERVIKKLSDGSNCFEQLILPNAAMMKSEFERAQCPEIDQFPHDVLNIFYWIPRQIDNEFLQSCYR